MAEPDFFLDYRTDLYKRFDGLFGGSNHEDDAEPEESDKSGGRSFSDRQAEQAEQRQQKWNWIGIIYDLCRGDITKTEAIVNKTFIECLIWLSYEKEMNIKK